MKIILFVLLVLFVGVVYSVCPREPQCNDLVDNDTDGFIDLADPDCTDALDDDEEGTAISFVAPTITKAFSPDTIETDQVSTITVTLNNSNALPVTINSISDTYPTEIVNATPSNSSNNCGGVLTAVDGGPSWSLSGGTIAATGSCNVTINVTSSTAGGPYLNTTSILDTVEAPDSSTASDSLTVNQTSSGTFNFIDVSNSVLADNCPNPSTDSFAHTMGTFNGETHLFTFSHNQSREAHCAWRWNSNTSVFEIQGSNTPDPGTGLSGQIAFGTNENQGCCGWATGLIDIDGDGDLDIHSRTTEGADGYFENNGTTTPAWIGSDDWKTCASGVRSFLYDADGDGVIEPALSTECNAMSGDQHFFDHDNDGTPSLITVNTNCDALGNAAYLDAENDGDMDIICSLGNTDPGGRSYYISINTNGNFNTTVVTGLGHAAGDTNYSKGAPLAVDINNDGFVDYIGPGTGSGDGAMMLLSNGNGTFTNDTDHGDLSSSSGKNQMSGWDYDGDCDIDLIQKQDLNTNNVGIYQNQNGGNCLSVDVDNYDKVTVRRNDNNAVVFHYEYIVRHVLSQIWGKVHVGLGSLTPSEVNCTIDPVIGPNRSC